MSATSGMGGGKKSVNVELNLVPFIDLLSTLICFLLITAVWQHISALSTNTSSTTSSDNPPPQPKDEKKVDLSVSLLTDRLGATEGTKVTKIPHLGSDPDYPAMVRVLNEWKSKYPEKSDLVIYSDNQAYYKQMIRLMDIMAEAKFNDVGVNAN